MTSFSEQLNQANTNLGMLIELLRTEFNALANQDLVRFQTLQNDKLALLQQIRAFDNQKAKFLQDRGSADPAAADIMSFLSESDRKLWNHFIDQLKVCDEEHRKVDHYLNQKIKMTNELLEILQVSQSHNATKLYDAYGASKLSTIGNKISEA